MHNALGITIFELRSRLSSEMAIASSSERKPILPEHLPESLPVWIRRQPPSKSDGIWAAYSLKGGSDLTGRVGPSAEISRGLAGA